MMFFTKIATKLWTQCSFTIDENFDNHHKQQGITLDYPTDNCYWNHKLSGMNVTVIVIRKLALEPVMEHLREKSGLVIQLELGTKCTGD